MYDIKLTHWWHDEDEELVLGHTNEPVPDGNIPAAGLQQPQH